MVFVFDTKEKIEDDRRIEEDLTERHTFVQTADDILREPRLTLKIGEILEPYVEFSREYRWHALSGGILNVFAAALLNAATHGNKNKPGSSVQVEVKYGVLGSSIRVMDTGPGFDYAAVIGRFKKGEPYATGNGSGMVKFDKTRFQIAYHGNGNLVSISTPSLTVEDLIESRSNAIARQS